MATISVPRESPIDQVSGFPPLYWNQPLFSRFAVPRTYPITLETSIRQPSFTPNCLFHISCTITHNGPSPPCNPFLSPFPRSYPGIRTCPPLGQILGGTGRGRRQGSIQGRVWRVWNGDGLCNCVAGVVGVWFVETSAVCVVGRLG
jgi:hypothetical protein